MEMFYLHFTTLKWPYNCCLHFEHKNMIRSLASEELD